MCVCVCRCSRDAERICFVVACCLCCVSVVCVCFCLLVCARVSACVSLCVCACVPVVCLSFVSLLSWSSCSSPGAAHGDNINMMCTCKGISCIIDHAALARAKAPFNEGPWPFYRGVGGVQTPETIFCLLSALRLYKESRGTNSCDKWLRRSTSSPQLRTSITCRSNAKS